MFSRIVWSKRQNAHHRDRDPNLKTNMLSFFRTKSTDTTQVDGVVTATQNLTMQSNSPSTTNAEESTDSSELLKTLGYANSTELKETIYGWCLVGIYRLTGSEKLIVAYSISDILRTIRDPEKPSTLEDLNVVYEEGVFIQNPTSDNVQVVSLETLDQMSLSGDKITPLISQLITGRYRSIAPVQMLTKVFFITDSR